MNGQVGGECNALQSGLSLFSGDQAFLQLKGKAAVDVFGGLDTMKVLSCMTLFNEVASDDLFHRPTGPTAWRGETAS